MAREDLKCIKTICHKIWHIFLHNFKQIMCLKNFPQSLDPLALQLKSYFNNFFARK